MKSQASFEVPNVRVCPIKEKQLNESYRANRGRQVHGSGSIGALEVWG